MSDRYGKSFHNDYERLANLKDMAGGTAFAHAMSISAGMHKGEDDLIMAVVVSMLDDLGKCEEAQSILRTHCRWGVKSLEMLIVLREVFPGFDEFLDTVVEAGNQRSGD